MDVFRFRAPPVLRLGAAILLSAAAPPLVAAQGDPAPAGSRSVDALDIFYACRDTEAFRTGTELNGFCSIRLPTLRSADSVTTLRLHAANEDLADTIHAARRRVEEARRSRQRTAASSGLSHDLARGEIVFQPGEPGLPPGIEPVLAQVASQATALRENGTAQAFYIVQYGASRDPLRARAGLVRDTLQQLVQGALIEFELVDSVAGDSARAGRVAVRVRLPLLPAETFPGLHVPFEGGSSELGEGALLQLASAAAAIRAHPAYQNGALVDVPYPEEKNLGPPRRDAILAELAARDVRQEQIRMRLVTGGTRTEAPESAAPATGLLSLGSHAGPGSRLAAPPPSAAHAFGLSWESVAQAATDALVERASREVQQYVLASFGKELCTATRRPLFGDTCILMLEPRVYAPSLETLRGAVQSDAEAFPERALHRLLQMQGTEDTAYAERALLAYFTFRLAGRVQRGEDPVEVLVAFPEWRKEITGGLAIAGGVAERRGIAGLERVSTFIRAARQTAGDLHAVSGGTIAPDTIYRYAALRLLVNHGTDTRLVDALHQTLEAQRRVQAQLVVLDTVRARLVALRARGDTAASLRRELFAQAIDALVRTATVELDLGGGVAAADSLARLRQTVSDLVVAVRTRSFQQALRGTASLLPELMPPARAQAEDAFLGESVRLLTLATDIAEARSQDELRQAMSRFVADGGSASSKRWGRPRMGIHLNAYVGGGVAAGGGAERSFVLRLPIGAEVVLRQAHGSWPVPSLYFQVLDLGGFLPQSGDGEERSADLRLASVVNPGAFLMFSLADAPVSVGAGVMPRHSIENDTWRSRLRTVAFIAVDLPILRLR